MDKPFRILGIQQIAIGGPDKQRLRRLWVDVLDLRIKSNFVSERENVDEDVCALGEGAHAVTLRSAPDICPADDVRHLAVDTREEVRVLCVDGDPHPDEDPGPERDETIVLRHPFKN